MGTTWSPCGSRDDDVRAGAVVGDQLAAHAAGCHHVALLVDRDDGLDVGVALGRPHADGDRLGADVDAPDVGADVDRGEHAAGARAQRAADAVPLGLAAQRDDPAGRVDQRAVVLAERRGGGAGSRVGGRGRRCFHRANTVYLCGIDDLPESGKEAPANRALSMLPAYAELHCRSNFSSCPAPRTRRNSSCARRRWATRRWRSPTTARCAGIVRAHLAARDAGLPPDRRQRVRRSATALRLVLLAPDRASYGNLCQLITRGRRQAAKGRYRPSPRRRRRVRGRPLAAVGAAATGRCARRPTRRPRWSRPGRWVAATFPGRSWLAVELLRRRRRRGSASRGRAALAAACGLPPVAAGDVHMHVRARRALQDTLTAIRLGTPLAECGYALFPNGERHLRSRERLACVYPPELLADNARRSPRAAASRSTNCATNTRRRSCRPAPRRPRTSPRWSRPGCGSATRRRAAPDAVRRAGRARAGLIAELGYEPYFLTVHDIVAFARGRGILCQGRGSAANSAVCYALGITEVDPARMLDAVRALHQPRAQRAARHRRRLRAPAARGGHPVHLRQVRPRPRGAGRDADHLPAEERGARRRQGAGARPRAGRPPDRRVRLVGRPRGPARAHPRGGLRARQRR